MQIDISFVIRTNAWSQRAGSSMSHDATACDDLFNIKDSLVVVRPIYFLTITEEERVTGSKRMQERVKDVSC